MEWNCRNRNETIFNLFFSLVEVSSSTIKVKIDLLHRCVLACQINNLNCLSYRSRDHLCEPNMMDRTHLGQRVLETLSSSSFYINHWTRLSLINVVNGKYIYWQCGEYYSQHLIQSAIFDWDGSIWTQWGTWWLVGGLRKEKRGWGEWGGMGWGRGLLSVYQSLVWLGCARIKKLFVGHIRGNKRLRCQYDLMNYFYSCHSHTLSTLFFFLVQFIMEPLKISTLYIFGCLECIIIMIIIIITTMYPLPEQSVFPLQDKRRIFCL